MSDLISRKAAIEALKRAEALTRAFGYHHVIETIRELPSAEPRKGKWIEQDDGWGDVFYECSCCKEAFMLIDGTPTDNNYYYCPNCGARMEE